MTLTTASFAISIHAPLAGSDVMACSSASTLLDFNPRSPCGERLPWIPFLSLMIRFQSTLPLRGATTPSYRPGKAPMISIHAPLAGSDEKGGEFDGILTYFNPRSPCGERLDNHVRHIKTMQFQSTLPLRGATIIK